MKNGSSITILVLVIIAVVLGYSIYNQSFLKTLMYKAPQPQAGKQAFPLANSISRSGLTADEQTALKTPGANASQEERKKHFDAAFRAAKNAEVLQLGQCQGTPVVLRVKKDKPITVNNQDYKQHQIIIDKDHIYSVPANGKTDLAIGFDKGPGLYGYGCDKSQEASGLFLVE